MSLEAPLVTVVIPVYNGEYLLGRTLASAAGQTYPDIEIIVVDDGSTDQTAAIVRQAAVSDRRIRLLHQQNAGVAAARNLAIGAARGSLIAPLDADDLWHPEKIAKQVAVMQKASAEVGLVYCWAVDIDDGDRVIPPISPRSTAKGQVLTELVAKAGFIDSASNPLIRRRYLDAVGGYDSALRRAGAQGCEDWKLYLALARICEFAVLPVYLVGYRRSATSMSANFTTMERSLEMVSRWIKQEWPAMPIGIERQMVYNQNRYLAHLALTNNQFGNSLRYRARAYQAAPKALFSYDTAQFGTRLLARVLGLKRPEQSRRTLFHNFSVEAN